jgi:hypothetical protein
MALTTAQAQACGQEVEEDPWAPITPELLQKMKALIENVTQGEHEDCLPSIVCPGIYDIDIPSIHVCWHPQGISCTVYMDRVYIFSKHDKGPRLPFNAPGAFVPSVDPVAELREKLRLAREIQAQSGQS